MIRAGETMTTTPNQQVEAAWRYHDGTKHSYRSVRSSRHVLDFANQPLPFKIYTTLEPIPLPKQAPPVATPVLEAIAVPPSTPPQDGVPDLAALAALLYLSGGITRVRHGKGWEIQYRAASCTGALYHIDLYLVCGELPGLAAGVYHFGVHDFALRRLRAGDYRELLARATGGEPAVAAAPAVIVCTSTFWRNAWKYQARAYRHCFWDAGTILANLLAAAAGQELPARVVLGFVDGPVNALLDLDTAREASLALVPLGRVSGHVPGGAPEVTPLALETSPLSRLETDYPAIRALHAASSLGDGPEAASWRGAGPPGDPAEGSGEAVHLSLIPGGALPADSVTDVILRRGSSRRFAQAAVGLSQLSTMLERATRGIPADFLQPPGATLNTLYVIAHAVDDLPPGSYVYHRGSHRLERLRQGSFRDEAGYLGLEQELPADASANVYCLSDLRAVLGRFGNRGYRAAQLEGGIIGGRLYLAAYALGLGATGLTFYDDEVTTFFSPHAAGKSVMFLTAVGHPARRRAVGGC
jgi:SagB-type dehydrogenase family enzyme